MKIILLIPFTLTFVACTMTKVGGEYTLKTPVDFVQEEYQTLKESAVEAQDMTEAVIVDPEENIKNQQNVEN